MSATAAGRSSEAPRQAASAPAAGTWRPGLRGTELLLLIPAAGVAVASSAPLRLREAGTLDVADLARPLLLVAAFGLVHLSLAARGSRADQLILPTLLVLTGISQAMNERLAPLLDERQWIWMLTGIAVLAVTTHAPYELRLLRRYRYTWGLAGLALVAATLLFGTGAEPGSPRLWLDLGRLQFQPSELLKLLLVVYLAGYLADKGAVLRSATTRIGPLRLPPLPVLAPMGIMLGVSLTLLAAQRDLGAALLLYAIGLGMLYLASGNGRYVAAGLVAFLSAAWLLLDRLAIAQLRFAIWRDPWSSAQGAGHQLVQALMALPAGGVLGTGLGYGLPTYIPAVHTDFVYAAIAEELGLAGAAAVLALYGILFWRGFRAAVDARDEFEGMLAGGLTLALAVQTFIIIGGILRLIPVTGITLPFLSHGGTSLLTSAASVGLVLRVSDRSRGNR